MIYKRNFSSNKSIRINKTKNMELKDIYFSMPKQVKDSGLLFDVFDIKDMVEKIYVIWRDENLRQELVQNGYNRTKTLTFENYAKKWNEVIEEALEIKKRGIVL